MSAFNSENLSFFGIFNLNGDFQLFAFLLETNQELIMSEGGITLLSRTADDAEDPQTLRMVAGAIANLCGNGTEV